MRIFKIELPATIRSTDPDVSLASDGLREQLGRELDALRQELSETVRTRAATYFPSDYTVFVRLSFAVDEHAARVTFWIDDPNVRWPNGLFARRAWKLSVPIMTHIVKEIFDARLRSVRFDDQREESACGGIRPDPGMDRPVDSRRRRGACHHRLLAHHSQMAVGLAGPAIDGSPRNGAAPSPWEGEGAIAVERVSSCNQLSDPPDRRSNAPSR